ncbi:Ubiquitin-conjugating enzyme E2 T [Dimargaris verticillata]|uniref:E2 ubiquitin-conjugating enzyme n=1 Tax=Dimargaris verticillata TaxID=2761393 RepID=A0A9W8B923_9FUNG|nr:Ubiquitin-conjugating enzyme E2 T [Dimargaris verticillata]
MAAMPASLLGRLKRELELLARDPPTGVICYPEGDSLAQWTAFIKGPRDTPYEGGTFKLQVTIPDRYPFEPPQIQFKTPVYHPNIDPQGRICLNLLKMPPHGDWKPSLNVSIVLTSLGVLLAEPNPNDPLLVDVANEYREQPSMYATKARQWTKQHATGSDETLDSTQVSPKNSALPLLITPTTARDTGPLPTRHQRPAQSSVGLKLRARPRNQSNLELASPSTTSPCLSVPGSKSGADGPAVTNPISTPTLTLTASQPSASSALSPQQPDSTTDPNSQPATHISTAKPMPASIRPPVLHLVPSPVKGKAPATRNSSVTRTASLTEYAELFQGVGDVLPPSIRGKRQILKRASSQSKRLRELAPSPPEHVD